MTGFLYYNLYYPQSVIVNVLQFWPQTIPLLLTDLGALYSLNDTIMPEIYMNMQQTSGSSGIWSDYNYYHSIFPMNQIFLYVFILNWRNMIIYLIYFFRYHLHCCYMMVLRKKSCNTKSYITSSGYSHFYFFIFTHIDSLL